MINKIKNISVDQSKISKILVIRLSSIGDVLHCSPIVQKLREHFPKAHIAWVVESLSQDVICNNSNLDEVFVWPRKEWKKEFQKTGDAITLMRRTKDFFDLIKKRNFDLTIDLHGMSRGALIAYWTKAPYRVCLSNAKEMSYLFANICADTNNVLTIQARYLSSLKFLGIDMSDAKMEMPITDEDRKFADSLLQKHNLAPGRFIALNPATSKLTKNWPVGHFAKLGDMISRRLQVPLVLLGSPKDRPLAAAINENMSDCKAVDMSGLMTLKQLGALIEKTGLMVTGDTGPLYMAEALGTPSVSMFSYTDPAYYAPKGHKHIALRAADCTMESISPDEVYQALEILVNKLEIK
jgi:lipopolysaccharide heptosyltransferase I